MTYQRRKAARPAEILDAALKAFAELSFAQTSMADIAQRAGVSRPTLYLYFKSKEEIFGALIRERIAPLIGNQPAVGSGTEVPADQQLEAFLRFAIVEINQPHIAPILRLVITEGALFPELLAAYHAQLLEPAQRYLAGLLKRGVAEGVFGPHAAELDPRALISPGLMAILWTSLFGADDPIDPDVLAQNYLKTLMPGLRSGRGD